MLKISIEGKNDGVLNMQRDSDALERASAGQVTLRVYDWDQAWVTLGMNQSPSRAVLSNCPCPTVLRPTGGKAVLHGHDLTVGFAVPLSWVEQRLDSGVLHSREVKKIYRVICEPLMNSLCESGVPAVLGEDSRFVREKGHSTDCFMFVSPNDIIDPRTGQKVCGCALRITEAAALIQASIPIAKPLVDPALVFEKPAGVKITNPDRDKFCETFAKLIAD